MSIYEKMSAITKEISAVAKDLNVGYGKNQYKATSEQNVLAAVKPLEEKYRVYSYPCNRQIVEAGVLVNTNRDGQEIRQNFIRIETTYRFVDVDKPEEYIDVTTYGDGVDSQDKAPGKAMTYGDKYALLKAYKIITGDDPDQDESQTMKSKGKTDLKPVTSSINAEPQTAETQTTEKARSETLNETEWQALQRFIAGLAPQKPETKEDMKRLIDDVLARYGHTSDLWRDITVGVQKDIVKDEEILKEDLKKAMWKEAFG